MVARFPILGVKFTDAMFMTCVSASARVNKIDAMRLRKSGWFRRETEADQHLEFVFVLMVSNCLVAVPANKLSMTLTD